MKSKKAILFLALFVCLIFCLTNGLMIQKAFAQKTSDDPGFGSKKPAKDANGKEIKKEDKTPKPYQIAIGVGSFVVMILVIKFV